jgi:hypothetical protein
VVEYLKEPAMTKKLYAFISICCLVLAGLTLAGCHLIDHKKSSAVESDITFYRFPWEIWEPGQDLNGRPLSSQFILRGDNLVRQSLRENALAEYQKALKVQLTQAEREALTFRIASTQLSLGQSSQARTTLRQYFVGSNTSVHDVRGHFALLYAHVYENQRA